MIRTEGAAALTGSTLVTNVPFAQTNLGIVTIVLVTALNVAMMIGAAVYFGRKYWRRKLKKDDKYAFAKRYIHSIIVFINAICNVTFDFTL